MSTAEENKALVRRFFACIDAGDFAALAAFYDPDLIDRAPTYPNLMPGLRGVEEGFALSLLAFTDVVHVIEDQIAEGDRVVTRVTATGTHSGVFRGVAATGRRVSMDGIAIHRIVDGRIVEHWGRTDLAGLLQQMGAIELH